MQLNTGEPLGYEVRIRAKKKNEDSMKINHETKEDFCAYVRFAARETYASEVLTSKPT